MRHKRLNKNDKIPGVLHAVNEILLLHAVGQIQFMQHFDRYIEHFDRYIEHFDRYIEHFDRYIEHFDRYIEQLFIEYFFIPSVCNCSSITVN